jgi:hypothetical protein
MRYVPHRSARAVDQNPIHKNGCGPVSWLNAYRFSSTEWRATTARLTGTDQQQFDYLTRKHAFQFSKHVYMKRRWDPINGMRPRDLLAACNDFHKKAKLPPLQLVSLFLEKGETHTQLMQRTQLAMIDSLEKGFPPILHLSRFEKRTSPNGGHRWATYNSHYVTLYSLEKELTNNRLKFQYIDPIGGRICKASLTLPDKEFYAIDITKPTGKGYLKQPSLVANCPETLIGSPHKNSELVLGQMLVATEQPTL